MFKWVLTAAAIVIGCYVVFWIVKSLPTKPHWAEWLMLGLAMLIIVSCVGIMLGALWF